ncbi:MULTISPECIES: ribose-phosphate diphosphokinase [Rhodanobacter]|uniref:ribose-phosphate diphosphokinase n=1 Tax=Rhodanobacter TaxID=75309 RepID=UPI000402BF94|nr:MULTISPECIES: ribose-phosphate diphosphokinase [Rhodanobacter]TAN15927.1 MAG: ribose-phosphate diphosphokinase [Rhodanobacter sp.]UJJ53529.1 ribose-phosphate diphosphokinase [Rhodanobacter thiooxydans]
MNRVLIPFPANAALAATIAPTLRARLAPLAWRHFPDGESLVALDDDLQGADVVLLASLHDPDSLALPLRFAAQTAREFGARSVGLVAPYLGYMRQDTRFHRGEAISARLFARFLEEAFDWLVTVDPHLHRYPRLDALYRIPVRQVSATPAVAGWIAREVPDAMLIGPDSESEQWVAGIAAQAHLPYQVLSKERHGDYDVRVSLPDATAANGRTPVLVDDIVSSGHTLLETLKHLQRLGLPAPVLVAIHPVFAGDAYARLQSAGLVRIVSTDTIAHASNTIPMGDALAVAVSELMARGLTQGAP